MSETDTEPDPPDVDVDVVDASEAESAASGRRWKRLASLLGLVLFGVALWTLRDELSRFDGKQFANYLGALGAPQVVLVAATTVAAYAVLVGYDWFALRYIGKQLPLRRTAFAAFVGYACSLNIGQAALSGGAVRMRLYTAWGLRPGDVARIVGFNLLNGGLGHMLLTGITLAIPGLRLPPEIPLPLHSLRGVGYGLLALAITALLVLHRIGHEIRFKRFVLVVPPARIQLPAVAVAVLDWTVSTLVLYALLPADADVGVWQLLGVVMAAHIVATLSMVPGGLGVLEMVVVHLLSDRIPSSTLLSALLAFRAVYYLIPFIIALLLLGAHEFRARHPRHRSG